MTNNIYSKIKKFIKENLFFILLPIIVISVFNIPLPYYVEAPGGIINIEKRVNVLDEQKLNGTLNLAYVSSYDGSVGTYLMSKIFKSWDIVPSSSVKLDTETRKDVYIRNRLLLDNSLSNAYVAANKYLNKNINTEKSSIYVLYIDKSAVTNLEVGDEIKKLDNIDINSSNDIFEILSKKKVGDKLKVVVNDNIEKYINVGLSNNNVSLNISVVCNYDYNEDVTFSFKNGESGPSGGFMIALSIYAKSIDKDIIKGRNIVGTGTIDEEGHVGEIGGIKYKIIGAVKNNVDLFFVPQANYEEAKKVVKENNYDINLVAINNLSDAIDYLENN